MRRVNEIKDQQAVVTTVGSFTNSLQQIAAMRMVKLKEIVISSRRFVDEATLIIRELYLEKAKYIDKELKNSNLSSPSPTKKSKSSSLTSNKKAIIVITSDIGLCGSYNQEIFNKLESIMPDHQDADYFILGRKGQNYLSFAAKKYHLKYFPFNIPEEVSINDLKPIVGMFYYYQQIFLVYSRYVNTTNREVVFMELSVPHVKEIEVKKEQVEGKYLFEPNLDELISSVTARIRAALFRQQILDSKLSLYTAQMIAMKTASDNASDLLTDLQWEFNKTKRKLIDKKILEVQAGRSLWDSEEDTP